MLKDSLNGFLIEEEGEEDFDRDVIRLVNQFGSLGAFLGFGGMTLGVDEDEEEAPSGGFTLGKAGDGNV